MCRQTCRADHLTCRECSNARQFMSELNYKVSYTPSVSGELQNWSVCIKKQKQKQKNTYLLTEVLWKWKCSVVFNSLWPHGLYSPWNSPGQNTEVGSLSLLQGIFPNQTSNSGLPHCRWILYQLSYQGRSAVSKRKWIFFPLTWYLGWQRGQTSQS